MSRKLYAFQFFLLLVILPLSAEAVPLSTASESTANSSSLIKQMVEQNFPDPNIIFGPAFAQLLNGTNNIVQGNDIGQTIANWFNNGFFKEYLPDIISSLSSVVKSFFLNPNLAQITASSTNANDLSFLLSGLLNIIYGIAFDLLFVLFVFAIWQYWTKASWHGNISAMSAVGRLICTIGIVVAWPTIYSFEIELSNEMISAIFANGTQQLHLFDMVMANMFNIGAYSGLLGTLMMSQPVAIGVAHLGGFLSVVAMFALCVLAIILIYELVYLITLKAMQMALLTAQYVFAPVFLIFFATPSTEKIATGYICTFAETSLWSFIWIGLLKILIILMYANFNPCGKIITAIGVLQLMMRVPQFLGRFKVSPAASFVNPASLTEGLQKRAFTYAGQIENYKNQFVSAMSGMFRTTSAARPVNASSNSTSADFSFGGANASAADYAPPSPTFNKPRAEYRHSKDENVPTANTNLSTNTQSTENKPLTNIQLPMNNKAAMGEAKSIEGAHISKKYIPRRKNLPKEKDIFARHKKPGGHDDSNIIDFPINKTLPYGVPTIAVALLDSNSLPSLNPIGSNTVGASFVDSNATASFDTTGSGFVGSGATANFNAAGSDSVTSSITASLDTSGSHSTGSTKGVSNTTESNSLSIGSSTVIPSIVSFDIANSGINQSNSSAPGASGISHSSPMAVPSAGSIFSKSELSADRLSLTANKTSSSANSFLAVRESYRDSNANRDNSLAEESMIGYGKQNNNGQDHNYAFTLLQSGYTTETRLLNNKQTTVGQSLSNRSVTHSSPQINQHKTALYYAAAVYPGWQRPYYRHSKTSYLSLGPQSRRSTALLAGICYPAAPYFRSYYS